MNFLSTIALILLTLVGYSSGAVIVGRGVKKSPEWFDLAIVALLLAAALVARAAIGRQIVIPTWFVLSGLLSALLTQLTKGRYSEGRSQRRATPAPVASGFLRQTWERWIIFAREMGNYQGRILFAFFYFIVVTPFGIGVRLFSDPL